MHSHQKSASGKLASAVRALKMPVAFSIPAYAPERARPAQLGSAYFGTRAEG